jgi:hypothetical protein
MVIVRPVERERQYRRDATLRYTNTNIQRIKLDPLIPQYLLQSIAMKTNATALCRPRPKHKVLEQRVAGPNQVTSFQIWELSFSQPAPHAGPCREARAWRARGRVVPCIAAYSHPNLFETSARSAHQPQLPSRPPFFLFATCFYRHHPLPFIASHNPS